MDPIRDDRTDIESIRATAVFIASECIPPARFWEVCLGDGLWQPLEREHLERCDRCRAREEKVSAATALLGAWEFPFSKAASVSQRPERFATRDGLVSGSLRCSRGRLELVVEVQPAALGDRLVRFELSLGDEPPLQGFVGLYPFEGGKGLGCIILTTLRPGLRRLDFNRCKLSLRKQARGELRPEDRSRLELSRDASPDVRCRQVLDDAIKGLPGTDAAGR